NTLSAAAVAGQCIEPGLHAGAEFRPWLDAVHAEFAAGPTGDHHFKHLLKSPEPFFFAGCGLEILVERMDMSISLHQLRQRLLHYHLGAKLIELVEDFNLRPMHPGFFVGLARDPRRLPLANPRTGVDAVKDSFVRSPVFPQEAALDLAFLRELIVVGLEK